MEYTATNGFKHFFEEDIYIKLKNYLYNYRLRKFSIEKLFKRETSELILEVGSGVSPVMTKTSRIIYSDLSPTAIQVLKRTHGKGHYVVADGINLPFKSNIFSHAICSEMLEHVANDVAVLKEVARVMRSSGHLIVTFPHRKFYFTMDDRFVNHYRRYEISEMQDKLKQSGFRPILTKKILGPLEKVTMCMTILVFSFIQRMGQKNLKTGNGKGLKSPIPIRTLTWLFKWANQFYMGLAWLDARIMPRALSTVLLIHSTRVEL